jgi:hypothetical protein
MLPGIIDINYKQKPKTYFKVASGFEDKVTLTKETRMPIEYLCAPVTPKPERRRGSFPHPIEHLNMVDNWRHTHAVTVSRFNNVHHKS